MEPERQCQRCGRKIPWGQAECPFCPGHGGYFWSLRRDTFLTLVIVSMILLITITGIVVKRYHRVERGLARDWYLQGEEALRGRNARLALVDFRNALAFAADNSYYQLRLAVALAATGRVPEARIYLQGLRDRDPGNGPVNLELARLAASEHDIPGAVQYYHDAVYCEWNGDAVAQRRAVRLELINFLFESDQRDAARAELIAVAANLGPDAGQRIQVGTLLMRAGGCDDALRLFREVVATDPTSAPALAGTGECYFLTGQYADAENYLSRALVRDPKMPRVAEMRDTAREVMELDPFLRRLSEVQRASRERQALDLGMERLQACAAQRRIDLQAAAPNDAIAALYAQAVALRPAIQRDFYHRDTQGISNTMDLVFEIEKTTSRECGEPLGRDLALLLIGREQEGIKP